MTEKANAKEPKATTETQIDDKAKPPKKKRTFLKIILIAVILAPVISYLTYDPVKDATEHDMKLEGTTVVSNYRFSHDVNAGDWSYVYDSVAQATVVIMEELPDNAQFKDAKEANLRFNILGTDKYGKDGTFMIAEFHIPLAEWKKYSTKITGDWLLIAPILKQFYYDGDPHFEKNLRNQKEYGS